MSRTFDRKNPPLFKKEILDYILHIETKEMSFPH
jgi:hypothetical protein